MSLVIRPRARSWDYIITYQRDPEKPDQRNYELVLEADSTGHFVVDEQNSILLDGYLNGDCLYVSFGGMGSELLSRSCLRQNQLDYEIVSVRSEPVRISGDQVVGTDTIPAIRSYGVYHVMRAVLTRE
jgi:hypothetical protein